MLLWTPGIWELAIILALVLLFAGKNRLPELARSIGSGITEFRKGLSGQAEEEEPSTSTTKKKTTKKTAKTKKS